MMIWFSHGGAHDHFNDFRAAKHKINESFRALGSTHPEPHQLS